MTDTGHYGSGERRAKGRSETSLGRHMKFHLATLLVLLPATSFAWSVDTLDSAVNPSSLVAHDHDGDGDLDLFVADESNSLHLYENLDGTLGTPTTATLTQQPYLLRVGDVNGDGEDDIAIATNGTNGLGYWPIVAGALGTPVFLTTLNDSPRGLEIVDIDGDGDLDYVTGDFAADDIQWAENDNGSFPAASTQLIASAPNTRCIAAADFTGDGLVDVIACNASVVHLDLWTNDGALGFTRSNIDTSSRPYTLATADVDGDGDLDTVHGSTNPDYLGVSMNQGDGTFVNQELPLPTGVGAREVAFGDLDGDGQIDVAAVGNDGVLYVSYGTGTTFGDPEVLDDSVSWDISVLEIVDLDGDGDNDILGGASGLVMLRNALIEVCDDTDGDGVCDDVDICDGDDSYGDADLDGWCDPELTTTSAFAGETFTMTLAGLTPDYSVIFLGSGRGTGSQVCHPTIDVCIDLVSPTVLGTVVAAEDGTAQLGLTLPTNLVGREITVQAVVISGSTGAASEAVANTVGTR